jgi:coproporphyrinogen III oxidase-like Fe-S oxidoreductase
VIHSLERGIYAHYVHMPFCHRPLCRFCCFVRYPYEGDKYRLYMAALRREAEWLASSAEGASIRLVYIGGGTPTINIYGLAEFIDLLRSYFGRGLTVSVEGSPKDIDDEAVSILQSLKVARLSIGVQALRENRLREMGRLHHGVEDSLRAVEAARGKFPTLNIDMIWGIRSDDPETVYSEASRALELGASQVTFYPLMPAPGLRRLEKERREGPWHPLEPRLYESILSASREKGYRPATAWCMDKGSQLIDEYIVDYDKFLAIGLSGIGRLGNYTYVNSFSVERYAKLVSQRGHAAIRAVRVTRHEDMLYYASAKLFGLRFDPRDLIERYGDAARPLAASVTAALSLLGVDGAPIDSSPAALYALHVMQRSIYMAVNMLREWGMRSQE